MLDNAIVPKKAKWYDLSFDFAKELPTAVGTFFRVCHLNNAGFGGKQISERRLYCRQNTIDLLQALKDMDAGLRIMGPPGVGKSITTWLWACHQVHAGKTVLWIHLGRKNPTEIVLLTEGGIENQWQKYKLSKDSFISEHDADIVIIDGVRKNDIHDGLDDQVFCKHDNPNRISVSVASSAIKIYFEEDTHNQILHFNAIPWSLEDYYAAIRDDIFFAEVESMLLENGQVVGKDRPLESRLELVDNKFFYSGFSARWTFSTPYAEVIKQIRYYLESVSNISDLLAANTGEKSAASVNHLMCRFENDGVLTSKYISDQILKKFGDQGIIVAYRLAGEQNNPVFIAA